MISPYGPSWIGGISVFTTSLSDSLRNMGGELVVNLGGVPGRTVTLRGPKPLFVIRTAIWLRRRRPNVLHAHAHWHTLLPALLYKAFHRGVKVVFTVHTPQRPGRHFSSWFLSRLMARCDVVTSVSGEITGQLRSNLPMRVWIRQVRPGATIRLGGYHEARRSLAIPERSFVAAFVGPLHWAEKVAGVKLLVRSFHEFSHRVPESRLLLIGGGPYLRELRRLVGELDGSSCVLVVGETEDPAPYFHACDVYVHISFLEGLPLSMLEAMLVGKPVIASRVGAIPEVLEDGVSGILVANNETEIVEALSRLHADSALRDTIGRIGHETVLRRYTWGSAAQEFVTIYGGA